MSYCPSGIPRERHRPDTTAPAAALPAAAEQVPRAESPVMSALPGTRPLGARQRRLIPGPGSLMYLIAA
jgi:hypothetical protein